MENWRCPRKAQEYSAKSDTITISGDKSRAVKASVQDVCPAIADDTIAQLVQEANGTLDELIYDSLLTNGDSNGATFTSEINHYSSSVDIESL